MANEEVKMASSSLQKAMQRSKMYARLWSPTGIPSPWASCVKSMCRIHVSAKDKHWPGLCREGDFPPGRRTERRGMHPRSMTQAASHCRRMRLPPVCDSQPHLVFLPASPPLPSGPRCSFPARPSASVSGDGPSRTWAGFGGW